MTADLGSLLQIDSEPGAPSPFEQIKAAVVALVSRGEILVGQRLPTVRKLAAELDLAPNTVARSYRELEAAGIIETRGRLGSFIKAGSDTTRDQAQQATVEHVRAMRALGIDDQAIVAMVTQATSPT